jgi:Zn ribbon nucleic-acid-binding protein
MLKFVYCPRCKRGNMALDKDNYGWYEYCIQCGYLQDLDGEVKSLQHANYTVRENDRKLITATFTPKSWYLT